MKILVVDDSQSTRLRLQTIFLEFGHNVCAEASNGFEAIRAFKEYEPELTTLDLVMPKMGGLEALQKILHLDPKAHVAVVTSAGTQKSRENAEKLGACYFLLKPFTRESVKEMLEAIEKKSRAA